MAKSKGYITPGVCVQEIDVSKTVPFVLIEMDDLNFEELVGYVEYAKDNQWVLSTVNKMTLRDDLIKDIICDYFEKLDINIHPGQVTKIYEILIELGINTDNVIYIENKIRTMPTEKPTLNFLRGPK